MAMRGENWRFWTPVLLLTLGVAYIGYRLVSAHIDPKVSAPDYTFTQSLIAPRGAIYSACDGSAFVKSVPYWEYSLDPVALTNAVVKPAGEKVKRSKGAIVRTIANALKMDYAKVLAMASRTSGRAYRDQFLALSSDSEVHRVLSDSSLVAGVAIKDRQVRQYIHGRHLSHVLGSVNSEGVGSSGIELRYNRNLTGTPGTVRGLRDARRRELYDKREVSIDPVPGDSVYLTIDPNVQFEAEEALRWGVGEYGAGSGWCIVMDARTGAVRAMASLPDYDPARFGRVDDSAKKNRAIAFNYEPGSVMKVVTAAAALDADFVTPDSRYSTDRDDPRYFRLPGDGSHVWESTMSIRDAIIHSSNIVIGKLGFDFGADRLYAAMRRFGFGEKTGIELPGEERGILPPPQKWDLVSRSRAPIGQFVSVTGIQLISAYQAIANDGVRMQPYLVERVVAPDGTVLSCHEPMEAGRPIKPSTARAMREIMLDVASPKGTARRAAIRGYSVAGKTGTAQKQLPGSRGYVPNLYRASFCGIVPASDPRVVVLVTLDFDTRATFHQGGNSAGPVFKRIATAALRYLMIPPDRPDELMEFNSDDEFDRLMEERAKSYVHTDD